MAQAFATIAIIVEYIVLFIWVVIEGIRQRHAKRLSDLIFFRNQFQRWAFVIIVGETGLALAVISALQLRLQVAGFALGNLAIGLVMLGVATFAARR